MKREELVALKQKIEKKILEKKYIILSKDTISAPMSYKDIMAQVDTKSVVSQIEKKLERLVTMASTFGVKYDSINLFCQVGLVCPEEYVSLCFKEGEAFDYDFASGKKSVYQHALPTIFQVEYDFQLSLEGGEVEAVPSAITDEGNTPVIGIVNASEFFEVMYRLGYMSGEKKTFLVQNFMNELDDTDIFLFDTSISLNKKARESQNNL